MGAGVPALPYGGTGTASSIRGCSHTGAPKPAVLIDLENQIQILKMIFIRINLTRIQTKKLKKNI
jgi:hypothetical protein